MNYEIKIAVFWSQSTVFGSYNTFMKFLSANITLCLIIQEICWTGETVIFSMEKRHRLSISTFSEKIKVKNMRKELKKVR